MSFSQPSRSAGAAGRECAAPDAGLGRTVLALPLLGALVLVEMLWGRSSPWVAAAVSALLALPAITLAGAWVVSGHVSRLLPVRLAGVGWALLLWMGLATGLGWSRLYTDEPVRRILLLGIGLGVGVVTGVHPEGRGGLCRYASLLGTALALVSAVLAVVRPEPDGRWASSLESPSLLGCFLCLSLPVTLAWGIEVLRARRNPLLVAAAAVQACALVGSGSRLALGALAVALAWWGLLAASAGWLPRARAAACAGLAVATVAAMAAVLHPSPGHESSASHRVFIWHTALRVIEREPWVGVGVGGFRTAFRVSRPWIGTDRSEALAVVRDAHNDVLHVTAETGVVGGALLAVLLGAALLTRPRRVDGGSLADAGLRAGLGAWVLNGLANGSIDVAGVAVLALAVAGCLLASGASPPEPLPPAVTRRRRLVALGMGGALAAAFAVGQAGARLSEATVVHLTESPPAEGLVLSPGLLEAARTSGGLDSYLALLDSLPSPEDRLRVLAEARKLSPHEAAIYARASLIEEQSEAGSGLRDARTAVALDSYNPYYRRQLADCLRRTGETDPAAEQYRLALALFERTLEVAISRNSELSPAAEAVRGEIERVRERLRDTEAVGSRAVAVARAALHPL